MSKLNGKSAGFSLVEVIVVSAIMLIVTLAIVGTLSSQQKESRALTEKFAALELQRYLTTDFNKNVCSFIFTDPSESSNRSADNFNSGSLPTAVIKLDNIPTTMNSAGPYLVKVGNPATPDSNTVVVESIEIKDFAAGPSPDDFTASIKVNYKASLMVRALKPSSLNISLTTDPASPVAAKKITSCTNVNPTATKPGLVIAVHSQTTTIPACPAAFDSVWSGYSYLFSSGGNVAGLQDLSGAGSCLEQFRPLIINECEDDNCDHQSGDDYSFWLSSYAGLNNGPKITGAGAVSLISRCQVCKSQKPTTLIVRHSQTTAVPTCPLGGTALWTGYSFVMAVGDDGGGRGGNQDLSKPGSCLPAFRPMPFAECDEKSCDHQSPKDFSYWLSTHAPFNDGPQINGAGSVSLISRCVVCSYTE